MTDRIHNFSAGPAVLPEPVLRKAQEAIWNVAGSGIGIMEHSHRGKVFDRIIKEAEQADRKSTRLNSSHMSISYAVFCLKKKKKKKRRQHDVIQTRTKNIEPKTMRVEKRSHKYVTSHENNTYKSYRRQLCTTYREGSDSI